MFRRAFSSAVSSSAASGHRHKILRGGTLAKKIFDDVKVESSALSARGWQPRLLSITVGNDESSLVYIRNQRRVAEKCGIEFEETQLSADVTMNEILVSIAAKNADPKVTGIIIQRPVPKHLDIKLVQQAVHPLKDVEGMHPTNLGHCVYSDAELAPCTARASVELLKSTGQPLKGMQACIVGHSEIVGKPISLLLMNEGATCTITHEHTRNLMEETRRADVLFVAVGKIGLITDNHVKPGATVIDIGINETSDGTVVGDVDFNSAIVPSSWITPVPGGVGTVTTAFLMRNAITAAKWQERHYAAAFGADHVTTNKAMIT